MKEKIKKIFAIFTLPVLFLTHFPFLAIQTREKGETIIKEQSEPRQENSEMPHIEYPIYENRDLVVSGIYTSASTVSIEDYFIEKNN